MDLHTVTALVDARTEPVWQDGDAWLAGGTVLFSEPQPHLRRLLDLAGRRLAGAHRARRRRWRSPPPAPIAELSPAAGDELDRAVLPGVPGLLQDLERGHRRRQPVRRAAGRADDLAGRRAGRRLPAARPGRAAARCRSPTSSPATARTALRRRRAAALDHPAGARRWPARTAFRQGSLHAHGPLRGAGDRPRASPAGGLVADRDRRDRAGRSCCASRRAGRRAAAGGARRADPGDAYVDDVHGCPAWRRHLTRRFAEEIRAELAT